MGLSMYTTFASPSTFPLSQMTNSFSSTFSTSLISADDLASCFIEKIETVEGARIGSHMPLLASVLKHTTHLPLQQVSCLSPSKEPLLMQRTPSFLPPLRDIAVATYPHCPTENPLSARSFPSEYKHAIVSSFLKKI